VTEIGWNEEYRIYATENHQAGEVIALTCMTPGPATQDATYTLERGELTHGYAVENQQGKAMGFGLAQQAIVNTYPRLAPFGLVQLPNGGAGKLFPLQTVSIFLTSYTQDGTVLAVVPPDAFTVSLTAGTTVEVAFNEENSSFSLA
jgi:hypothetical protein